MNIYFAGPIRGGRDDKDLYHQIIEYLKKYGTVLTEHIGSNLSINGELLEDTYIYERDMKYLLSSNLVVAECSTPSLGVGIEIGTAVEKKIPVIVLYKNKEKKISAMISGCKDIIVINYEENDLSYLFSELDKEINNIVIK